MIKYFLFTVLMLISAVNASSQTDVLSAKLQQKWRFENDELADRFLLSNEGLIAFSNDGKILMLDLDTGKVIWKNDLAGDSIANATLVDDKLSVISKVDEKSVIILFLSLKTGIIIKTENVEIDSIPYKNHLELLQYKSASDNGLKLYRIEKNSLIKNKNSLIDWKAKFGGNINDILFTKNGIIVSSTDNFVYLINEKKGNKVWKLRLSGKVLGAQILSEGIAIATVYGSSNLSMFNLQTGKLLNTIALSENEYNVFKPQILNQKVFIQTNGAIICFIPN
jgi:outer membrane protein assembly factor BamB